MLITKPACAADPFDLLLSPQDVLNAVERSPRLAQLRRRLCRPLDARAEAAEAAAAAAEEAKRQAAHGAAGCSPRLR